MSVSRTWHRPPMWVRVRSRLFGVLALVSILAAALHSWSTPSAKNPIDTVLAVVIATAALCCLIIMVITRREWPAAALGIFVLLAGDFFLWGVLVALARIGGIVVSPNLSINILRGFFFVASFFLILDMVLWLNARRQSKGVD